jgi:hypothetical protein
MLYVVTSISLNLLWFACRKNLLPSERFLWSFGVPGKKDVDSDRLQADYTRMNLTR